MEEWIFTNVKIYQDENFLSVLKRVPGGLISVLCSIVQFLCRTSELCQMCICGQYYRRGDLKCDTFLSFDNGIVLGNIPYSIYKFSGRSFC